MLTHTALTGESRDSGRSNDLADKRVVLTGASGGLGRVLASAFSKAGSVLGLVGRNRKRLEALARSLPGESRIYLGDVRSPEFNDTVAQSAVSELGGLDVWISNAGISPVLLPPPNMDPTVWRDIIDTNLNGAFFGALAAVRVMGEGGRIIFTGSALGERPRSGLSAYSASKAGLVGLMKSLALDLGAQGITVNLVAPGWFDSGLAAPWKANQDLEKEVLDHTAMGRWGTDNDLSGIYLYLASSAAAFVTGVVIAVDGGYLLT
ncbi:MAG: SDR family NAD(P)-dependent oxidoreductase [Actinomycetota bacterium]|nr:SDR family NAD(P)-dependent oxidoreductase [Actinomycetota bacterium]